MQKMDGVYIPGDRWVECDVCGFGYRYSEMRKGVSGKQKGLNICPVDFDPIHENENFVLPNRVEGKLKEVR